MDFTDPNTQKIIEQGIVVFIIIFALVWAQLGYEENQKRKSLEDYTKRLQSGEWRGCTNANIQKQA